MQEDEVPIEVLPDGRFTWGFQSPEINAQKAGRSILMPIVPDRHSVMIGRIAMSWGNFDSLLTQFLKPVCLHNGCAVGTVEGTRSFKKKKGLCLDQVAAAFGDDSTLFVYVRKMLDDASVLSVDRNLVLHGISRVQVSVSQKSDGTPVAIMRMLSSGWHNGRPIERSYSFDALENIYYGLANLEFRIHQLTPDFLKDGAPSQSSGIALHEILKLQALQYANS